MTRPIAAWLLMGTLVLVALAGWWLVPKWQMQDYRAQVTGKDLGSLEDSFRKTITQLLAGAAVLIGTGFAYLQFKQKQQADHDLLISNQVAKGFELLGHKDKDEVRLRLGGIYALEGVMNGSEQYYQPVLETLCAFVRDETRAKTGDDPPATEIQAALTVIGRRKTRTRETVLNVDLTDAHIPKAVLYRAALNHANLRRTDLRGAELLRADLNGADLRVADLREANLIAANLSGADLRVAGLISSDLRGANLSGANLSGANLRNALLGAELSVDALLATNLSGANLSGADLRDAKGLIQDQLDRACGDEDTKLDPPLTIRPCPQHWLPAAGSAK